ncbi:hypothetical protein [Burkholderia pseudomallei]|uniref:hypothetical protein n=1 Tax=Burkholderia pseudomallei TaxID=28450 RepID=UPI0015C33705|nr:hypothetical protein [Burkholderia pseudomallei]
MLRAACEMRRFAPADLPVSTASRTSISGDIIDGKSNERTVVASSWPTRYRQAAHRAIAHDASCPGPHQGQT